jgi:uncharacterized membrane protein
MDLVLLVVIAVILGFVIWILTTQVPMPPMWAKAIQVGALIVFLLYILTRFMRLPNVLPGN